MDKEKVRKMSDWGIKLSVALICVSLVIRLLCSDLSLRPGILRSVRLGLEMLLEEPIQRLLSWYAGNFFAPFLVFMLSVLPVLLLIVSLCVRFEVVGRILEHWPVTTEDDMEEEEPRRFKVPRKFGHAQPEPDPMELGGHENHEKAMAKLEKLKRRCGEKDIFQMDRGVRVQMLSGDPKQRTDGILEWDGNGFAAIRINAQSEIRFQQKSEGKPRIRGLCDLGANGEHDWREAWYDLKAGETLTLQRQNGSKTVDRYAITWLGGRE